MGVQRRRPPRRALVIAGSAGALPIILAQLKRLTFPTESAVFVVYHRSSNPSFHLADFARPCQLAIQEAVQGETVKANVVHHPRDAMDLEVRAGRLVVSEPQQRNHPNIDRLLASLADEYGAGVTAVLLSGMARDGIRGMQAIQEAGGRLIIQDPRHARFPQLPEACIAAGLEGSVVDLPELHRLAEEALATDPREFVLNG
ncbi:MAG TPA: chemotaxis protein CheB [Candidatus Thermoplasmatota archaeon]|nr:chemotaxis protein CheB [Candidatus Thermoplasmatota archaeon]